MAEEKTAQQTAAQTMPETAAQTMPGQVTFKRSEDFQALYANAIATESSVWDLKVIFGILDQAVQPNQIIQHTSVNLPWTWVKLLAYYTRIAVALHEGENGKINIPRGVLPPDPETITTGPAAQMPAEIREAVTKIYKEFIAAL